MGGAAGEPRLRRAAGAGWHAGRADQPCRLRRHAGCGREPPDPRGADERLPGRGGLLGAHRSRAYAIGLLLQEHRHDKGADAPKLSKSTIYEWEKLVGGRSVHDWMPFLAPAHGGGRQKADCDPEALRFLLSDWMRPEAPNFSSCYRRLAAQAAAKGWVIPSERTLLRQAMALPEGVRILKRQGEEALKRSLPAQRRDRGVFHALEAVNADGHAWDVFVRWPDGTIGRPVMCAFQDLYSGKILAWRVEQTLSWHVVRLAFGDLVESYGVPSACWLDNGREFASKMITGGAPNRYRFKLKEDEPQGLMTSLGVAVHWTTPYHGQAKPIERAFRDFAGEIAKHPAFHGAYTGNSPMAKPENYGNAAVPLEEFLAVVGQGIAEHNARPGRRSATCAGRSFDETFADSYSRSPKRARQAAWKRDKTARLRAERAAEAAQVGLADAVAESPLHIAIDRALAPDVTVLAPVPPAPEAALPPPAAPRPARDEGESVATTHKAVREYLVGRLIASGVGKLLAADRVAALTHAEALEQANERRVAAGQRPFRFVGAAPGGKGA